MAHIQKISRKTDIWQATARKHERMGEATNQPFIVGQTMIATTGEILAIVPLQTTEAATEDTMRVTPDKLISDDHHFAFSIDLRLLIRLVKAITPPGNGVDNQKIRVYVKDEKTPIIIEAMCGFGAGAIMPIAPIRATKTPKQYRRLVELSHMEPTNASTD